MTFLLRGLLAAAAVFSAAAFASASSLQVSPISVEVAAPGAVSSVTVVNRGTEAVNAQVRVLKWNQAKGVDELVKTKDVVASPPAMKLAPGKKSVIRVVRLSKAPVKNEETYRLLIDELPRPAKPGGVAVKLTIRQSIPVYFSIAGTAAKLSWSAAVEDGKLILEAANSGNGRAQIVDLKIIQDGKSVSVAEGLAGYVLAGSARKWLVKDESVKAVAGGSVKIVAKSNNAPVEATAKVRAAN